ncbi:MAG: hypothetical protein D6705_03850 [Deltaproteobacteria bacterium]|nr:MAG: hypothetical protein D6705_03850 [Deltaproteobacteria bacterium]
MQWLGAVTCLAPCLLAAGCECGYGNFLDDGSAGTSGGSTYGPPPWTSGAASTGSGASAGPADAGAPAGPRLAFVLHADPAVGADLEARWQRLERLLDDLAARNQGLPVPHHVTIMFTPNWGRAMLADPAKRAQLAAWIEQGHEAAFHSHTHNHAVRDGYTNAADLFGPDDWNMCMGDPAQGECTLDAGLGSVQAAVDEALGGRPYDIRFATIGPQGNDGPVPGGRNECPPGQDPPVADDHGCIDGEWTGLVNATIAYQATKYPGVTEADVGDPQALLGTSFCDRFGSATEDVYSLPIAPFETEAGSLAVSLETATAAFEMAGPNDFLGLVVHPVSYRAGPSAGYAGDARERIMALLDAADAAGLVSRTLGEIHDGDDVGDGVACRDLR